MWDGYIHAPDKDTINLNCPGTPRNAAPFSASHKADQEKTTDWAENPSRKTSFFVTHKTPEFQIHECMSANKSQNTTTKWLCCLRKTQVPKDVTSREQKPNFDKPTFQCFRPRAYWLWGIDLGPCGLNPVPAVWKGPPLSPPLTPVLLHDFCLGRR